ncbi:MAG: FAD-dependent oxidoreductase, partial [Candidatus Thermoplasmatota archaeon]|nr:FAD-dependent oxidoreductase [Candidatus Thermoplasmatota archaeon]
MNYDIVVVGAGPAGATAAKFLAEKGEKVLLIDKCSFP